MDGTLQEVGAADRARAPDPGRPAGRSASSATHVRQRRTLAASLAHALEHRRLFLLLPFAVIAGVISDTLAAEDPQPWALALVGAALVAALVGARHNLALLRALTLAGAYWAGFSLLSVHGALFGTPMLARPAYGAFRATVDAIISETPDSRTVIVTGIVPSDSATHAVSVRRARAAIKGGAALLPGDIITGRLRFYPVPAPVLPNGFDAQFQDYFQGIGAYGSAIGPVTVVARGDPTLPQHLIETVRQGIAARIDAVLPQPAASVARSMITGDQTTVPGEVRNVMAAAGIAHVLSISGLHLTLVAGGVFAAIRIILAMIPALALRYSVKKLAAIGGIVASFLYFSISGGNVAALRSTIMIALVLGAVVLGRRAVTMRNVAIAALIVIVMAPAGIFMPSFQLSFAAVAGLVGAFETLPREPRARGWPGRIYAYFAGAAATSLIAGAATLLFSAYHFQQTSPLGVLGNLLTLPLVGLVMMPSAVIAVLMMPFGFERPFLIAMGWSIDRMLDAARLVAGWSAMISASPLLTPAALLIGLAALGWFAFFTDRLRLIGPVVAIPAILLFGLDHPPDVLVSDTSQLVAVRGSDGLDLVSGKEESFAARVWEETYGQPIVRQPNALTSCDSLACVTTSPAGFVVSVVASDEAFPEDCATADLIVTHLVAPGYCRAETTVVDALDLARHGVEWLAWRGHDFETRQAVVDLNRPWRAGQS